MEHAPMIQGCLATLAVIVFAAGATVAQDRTASPDPAFELVSVEANTSVEARESLAVQPDGSVRFTAFPVRTLITMAYRSEGIQRFDQLVGAPSWIAVDRFDVVGKAGADAGARNGQNLVLAMLRSLLRDRFRLRVHSETRSMSGYALVVERRDAKLGPRLRQSTTRCPDDGVPDPDPDRWCGIRAAGGVITGRNVSVAQLAGNLSGYPAVDRFVTDRTGLTGRYDFTLEYAPGFLEPGDAVSTPGPSLFTALTEQLGLTLRSEMLVVPVLVIDTVEKPSPD
jgi:bla regulator protein blaR1